MPRPLLVDINEKRRVSDQTLHVAFYCLRGRAGDGGCGGASILVGAP